MECVNKLWDLANYKYNTIKWCKIEVRQVNIK